MLMGLMEHNSVLLNNNKIIFNFTDIYHWTSSPVGIVRVEINLVEILLRNFDDKHLQFCRFCAEQKQFLKVPRKEVAMKLKWLDDRGKTIISSHIFSQKQKLQNRISRIMIRSAIFFARKIIPSIYHSTMKVLLDDIKKFIYCVSTIKKEHANLSSITRINGQKDLATFEVQANDIFISAGLDWDNVDIKYFYNLKKRYGIKILLFVYDLTAYKMPSYTVPGYSTKLVKYFVDLFWIANHVITISNHSKQDAITCAKSMGINHPPISVLYLSANRLSLENNNEVAPNGIPYHLIGKNFILTVSTIEVRKNHILLYNIWRKLFDDMKGNCPILVIAGKRGWLVDDLMKLIENDYSLKKYIVVLYDPSDNALDWLYKNCLFTVFPSFYEGWGLPVAESFNYGKYCLASNAASLPEVTQGIGKQLDPLDFYAWFNKIKALVTDNDKLKSLEEQIKTNYKPITEKNFENGFLSILKQTIGK